MINGKVAIIHDWLNGMRGGEKVLEEILEIFPNADIFTLFLDRKRISEKIKSHNIITSKLNRFKTIRNRYKLFLPFFPSTIEEFDLHDYELIISSSHCVAKGVIPSPDATHVSYIHSPMRYLWDQYYSYFGKTSGLKKSFIKWQISKLRQWDVVSSSRVDYFIANSNFVKQRIRKYYRRESEVIHPPVDIDLFQPGKNPTRDYFLTVSALVPYKKVYLLVEAFNKTGDRLIVVGKGPEEKKIKRIAKKNIEFKKNISNEELKILYQNAIALVFAGVEDFGISFVEAQACGIPIIAFRKGGVLDIVKKNTGILFENQRIEGVIEASNRIREFDYKPSFIRKNSLKFSRKNFRDKVKKFLNTKL